ncbi:hypothetical protein DQ04_00191250 [Trypanosoma grayi]|uniref:hypothetical protein n=1 Tax=Trypanosoma grayi TaxID=71804 RepID=UPI0004F44CFD|nr:hypothetical protein DQ04_00191250 [Trypanosoma grayi]KEG15101.1 hypothetical protein DQ04_00191250 [Trypanosoma grayi]
MDASDSQAHVSSMNGNCVIVTTLLSSAPVVRTPLNASYSHSAASQWETVFGHRCPPALSMASHMNVSVQSDNSATGTGRAPVVYSPRYQASHDEGLTNQWQDETVKKMPNEAVSTGLQVLVPVNPNIGLTKFSVKQGAHLGPLIVVKRSRGRGAVECTAPLSEVEKLSYHREVDNLRRQLERAEGMLTECKQRTEQELLDNMRPLEESRREDERRHRQQFQEALSSLRIENDELTCRLKYMEEQATLAAAQERDKFQNEWSDRLAETERKWRERLRTAQQRWEESVDEHVREKHEALRQVQELAHTVEELKVTLLQEARERKWMEQERDTLLAHHPRIAHDTLHEHGEGECSERRVDLDAEVLVLRNALKDAEGREGALMAQLEACGNEFAAQGVRLERELQKTRQELESERHRGADLVKLYGSQVESLHQQLSDAMRRNRQLTKELTRFQ